LIEQAPTAAEKIAGGIEAVVAAEDNDVKAPSAGEMFIPNGPCFGAARRRNDDASAGSLGVSGFDSVDFVDAKEGICIL
jgi:hypothetical protein